MLVENGGRGAEERLQESPESPRVTDMTAAGWAAWAGLPGPVGPRVSSSGWADAWRQVSPGLQR